MKLSPELSIDSVEYASQGNAFLGIRNSGKTHNATYVAERLMDDGIPFIAFDPIGIWRYLKIGKNGPGYPVVVAGDNGDLPLTPQSAPDIVRAAMKENISLVVDLYSMKLSKKDWRTIVENCIRLLLYENKPCGLRHIFIEEAAEFVPQQVRPEEGRVYAEIEKLARMGGNASLGYTLINQRAEQVNKSVLENCDCLFLHRQKGKNSLTSLGKWLDVADTSNAREVINSLPSLEQGECWVWSQGSHDPQRIRMPEKRTVHPDRKNPLASSAGIPSDVTKFVYRMNKSLSVEPTKKEPLNEKIRGAAEKLADKLEAQAEIIVERDEEIKRLTAKIREMQVFFNTIRDLCPMPEIVQNKTIDVRRRHDIPVAYNQDRRVVPAGDQKLSKCARSILSFLAPYDREFSKVQIGVITGYSPGSGGFSNALGELSAAQLIIRGKGVKANRNNMDAIVAAIGIVKKQKYSIETFKEKLIKCEREIYEVVLKYPKKTFSKEELVKHTVTKYSVSSGGFSNAIGRLYSLQLIVREDGNITLNPELAKML